MVTELRASRPVARKEHRCSCCRTVISPGTRYHRSTNLYDGRVYDWIECEPCSGLLAEVWSWCGGPSEGVAEEDFWEWAHENRGLTDADRWRERNGCTCERCRPVPDDTGTASPLLLAAVWLALFVGCCAWAAVTGR